ncbi:hypothetical protein BSL82_17995 (plasmid) [Tardibacter chloracetimidivorans]|uniref:Transglycosylase SLT domain-containing protein n=2 Tax=Sphingomonadaceae TaxID=41297 RepID=A0A1L4A0I2_9SPHN|nr:lytic transglycosylase domain-containing protein [Tardibacter chloracetimidivorans]API61329.1 hypothetical protein BSL82_17995 [Tardibacter chloracetimidivorans]
MIVSFAMALDLARQCAPSVAPATILAIAHAESELDTLAINVNGGPKLRPATSAADAAALAQRYIAAGYSVDLGLGQINSNNLGWLGLSVEDTFDPCRNLAAAARVIGLNYSTAARGGASGPEAMGIALSLYNTGKPRRGFANGYVARVYRSAAIVRRGLGAAAPAPPQAVARGEGRSTPIAPAPPPTPSEVAQAAPKWDVFARPAAPALIFGRLKEVEELQGEMMQ